MRILITGALGFSARHLVRRLRCESGAVIVGSDIPPSPPEPPIFDDYHSADLTDFSQVRSLIQKSKPEWVFNLAGIFRGSVPDLYRVNVMSAIHLMDAVKSDAPQAAIMLVGSAAEYGLWPESEMPLDEAHACRPVGPYGVSKYAMTLAGLDCAAAARTRVIIARPFNLLGPGLPASLVIGAILQRARAALATVDPVVTVGNTASQRDFIAVEDVVDAYVALMRSGCWGEVVNICSGQPRSIRSVVEHLLSFAPRPIRLVEDPALFRPNDPLLVTGNPAKARRLCGFEPRVAVEEVLRASWFEEVAAPARQS